MSVAAARERAAPRVIGPYEILDEIGRGGMGVVYRAVRIDDGSLAALKMASGDMAEYFGFIRREIQTLRRLRHPGVVRILDEGLEKGVPWYAMELLDSHSLDELLGIRPYDPGATDSVRPFVPASGILPVSLHAHILVRPDLPRVLTLMYRLARVLAHIHAHGVIHRDIKPQNVLVRGGDRPVLVDFGLVGRFHAHSGRAVLEVAGMMLGTALYASPEQAAGELLDARTDLYSFGAMLYEIVAGAPPFKGDSVQEVLLKHLTREPMRPALLVHGVPPVLDDLIMRLLEKKRADRLGYAEDVAALLVEAGAEPDPDFESDTAPYLYRPELVGRQEPIAALRARIPSLRAGRGALVLMGGESGIGKTSVAAAFAREATLSYLGVTAGECIPVTASGEVTGQALHPLRPLFRAIADHCRAGGNDAIDRILGPRLAALREQEPALEALAELRLEGVPRMPPAIASRRLFSDLADTLAAFAREQPHVLVLDDLQWADEVTLGFLSSLNAEFFATVPLLILGTYRADEAGGELRKLLDRQHVVKMPLRRLDDGSVHEIVRSMLAAPDAPQEFLGFVSAEAEGNPFFVAEYLRAAVAERLLFREDGRWRVRTDSPYGTLALPGTVRDLVSRRLEALSPVAARVAEAAAVLGREIEESLLIAACGEPEDDAQTAIAELLDLYVFDPTDEGVRFAHDKLREAAYARVGPKRRAVLHMRAAEAIEASCANDAQQRMQAATLAHHWDVAGDPARAIRYYVMAAQTAIRTGACHEAKEQITRAQALDDRHPDALREAPAARRIRRAGWHRLLGSAWVGLGDLHAGATHAATSMQLLGVRMPESRAGWNARLVAEIARQVVHLMLPRRMFRARAAKVPLLTEIAYSAQKMSEVCYYATRETALLTAALLAVNTAERLSDALLNAAVYHTLGFSAGMAGLHRLADHYFAEGRRVAMAANDVAGLAAIAQASLLHYTATCDWKRGAAALEESRTLTRLSGDLQLMALAETACGRYEFYTGAIEKSVETFRDLIEVARKRANAQHEAWACLGGARGLTAMGRLDDARKHLSRARLLLEGKDDPLTRVVLHAFSASTLLHQNELDAAVEEADNAYVALSKTRPPFFEMLRGFSVPAEVYLEVWARARHRDDLEVERMRRAVRTLLRKLRGYTSRAPILLPTTLRIDGIAQCLGGSQRRGASLLRDSAAAASRLGLALDEGIALYELMRHTILDPRERASCRDRARAVFTKIGCELYLRKINEGTQRTGGFPAN